MAATRRVGAFFFGATSKRKASCATFVVLHKMLESIDCDLKELSQLYKL